MLRLDMVFNIASDKPMSSIVIHYACPELGEQLPESDRVYINSTIPQVEPRTTVVTRTTAQQYSAGLTVSQTPGLTLGGQWSEQNQTHTTLPNWSTSQAQLTSDTQVSWVLTYRQLDTNAPESDRLALSVPLSVLCQLPHTYLPGFIRAPWKRGQLAIRSLSVEVMCEPSPNNRVFTFLDEPRRVPKIIVYVARKKNRAHYGLPPRRSPQGIYADFYHLMKYRARGPAAAGDEDDDVYDRGENAAAPVAPQADNPMAVRMKKKGLFRSRLVDFTFHPSNEDDGTPSELEWLSDRYQRMMVLPLSGLHYIRNGNRITITDGRGRYLLIVDGERNQANANMFGQLLLNCGVVLTDEV